MNEQNEKQEDTDIDSAREDVARAEARLSNRWRAAKAASEQTLGRAMSLAKPVLIGAAVVGGVVLLVTSLSHRGRPRVRRISVPTEPPSVLKEAMRAAALALASAAARHVAGRYLALPAVAGEPPRARSRAKRAVG